MSDKLFSNVNTTLDLNGPTLVFTENPVGVVTSHLESATLTGIVTAVFPDGQTERSSNTGNIVLQWHVKSGTVDTPLVEGVNPSTGLIATGTGTTTLSLSNITNPTFAQSEFFLRADYIPSAYQNGTTGNAVTDPKDSNIAIISAKPLITIDSISPTTTTAENQPASFSVSANITDGSSLSYQWKIDGQIINEPAYASGDQSTTYTVTTGNIDGQNLGIGTYLVNCTVSNSNAVPPQVVSNDVLLNVVSARSIIAYELVDSSWNGGGGKDLVNQGFLEFDANDSDERSICIYPTEKDVDVLITLKGSKGDTKNGNRGGEGGTTSFRVTLNQNEEYFLRLGVPYSVGTGDRGGVVGGGGPSIFYRKANTSVVCGGGGGGGQSNRGGDGGGVGFDGEDGVGRNGGNGGEAYNSGTLDSDGSFARSLNNFDVETYTTNSTNIIGGELSTCTIGDYWANQGYSQCQDLGNIQYRNAAGTVITQTAQIQRGFKAGKSYRTNGGNGSGNQGGGGSGGFGGMAALTDGSGGGGGSGYTSGGVTVISSQRGGNNDYGYVKIEDYGSTLT